MFNDLPINVCAKFKKKRTITKRLSRLHFIPLLILSLDIRALDIRASQKTQAIRIPRENILEDYKLLISFEPYYKQWALEAKNKVKQNFYLQLFKDAMLMSDMLLNTYSSLLFIPPSGQDNPDGFRKENINNFLIVVAKFLHDFELYKGQVNLESNPIDSKLNNLMKSAYNAFWDVVAPIGESPESPGWGAVLVNEQRAPFSLPKFQFVFMEVTEFLRKYFISNKM